MLTRRLFPWLLVGALAPAAVLAYGCGDETNTSGPQGTAGSDGTGGNGGNGGGGNGGTGGISTSANCDAPTGTAGNLTLTSVATGLTSPLQLTYARGDSDRLYVIEQRGSIRLIKSGTLVPEPFLDISGIVTGGGEQGLLGLAFHPSYAENGRFFVHYTSTPDADNTVIAEYRRDPANPDIADPIAVNDQLLLITDFASNHNGGSLEFSPTDGFLYLGMGDGGGGGDPQENGQDPTALLGKLLRIDVDSMPGTYSIPIGNLQDTVAGAAPEVFDWGLRNPYRWNFDVCTGDRYIGDVGQNAWEEVDIAPASQGPTNWGWDDCEGNNDFEATGCAGLHAAAAVEYPHNLPGNFHVTCGYSVLGGYVYRGSAIPWLRGTYFYTEYCGGQTWTLVWQNGAVVSGPTDITTQLIPNYPNDFMTITGYGQDNNGEIYILDGANGIVYRIDPA